jgi:hypothetical protein
MPDPVATRLGCEERPSGYASRQNVDSGKKRIRA